MAAQNVFVYGTLMYPQVLQTLLNRTPRSSPAVIKGYQRYCIKGQVFPGVIPSTADSTVEGLLLHEITPDEMIVFDEFEGDEYYKLEVTPQLVGTDTTLPASVYICAEMMRPLLHGSWSPEEFAETHLQSYVVMCNEFITELREEQGRPQSRPLGFK